MNVRTSSVHATRGAGRIDGGRSLVDFDPATGSLVAESGFTLGQALDLGLPHGWLPPVLPGSRAMTLGTAVALDLHGMNHPEVGSIGRHVAWLDLIGSVGESQVLRPEWQPAQFWATVGGLGRTGAITVVALRLRPVDGRAWTVRQRGRDLGEVLDHLEDAHARADRRTDVHSVAWLDSPAPGRGLASGVVHTTRVGLRDPDAPLTRPAQRPRRLPWWPGGHGSGHPPRLSDQLGALLRGGRRSPGVGLDGLVQYQLAVPARRSDVLSDALDLLRQRGIPPQASVRRLGVPDPGPLTFARPGWALTLYLPARWTRLGSTLRELDDRVADAGGRVHLAGDHRPVPEALARMYPELAACPVQDSFRSGPG